jgi:hypothetical protein
MGERLAARKGRLGQNFVVAAVAMHGDHQHGTDDAKENARQHQSPGEASLEFLFQRGGNAVGEVGSLF